MPPPLPAPPKNLISIAHLVGFPQFCKLTLNADQLGCDGNGVCMALVAVRPSSQLIEVIAKPRQLPKQGTGSIRRSWARRRTVMPSSAWRASSEKIDAFGFGFGVPSRALLWGGAELHPHERLPFLRGAAVAFESAASRLRGSKGRRSHPSPAFWQPKHRVATKVCWPLTLTRLDFPMLKLNLIAQSPLKSALIG